MPDPKLAKFQGDNHHGSDNSAPYPVSRMAPATKLVDMAREIAAADKMLGNVTHGKLEVIAAQIRTLQEEAHQLMAKARRDQALHRAKCRFIRQPGKVYHLYRGRDDTLYFSMLAPREWGDAPPHAYAGSFRLENDMSWTAVAPGDGTLDEEALLTYLLDG